MERQRPSALPWFILIINNICDSRTSKSSKIQIFLKHGSIWLRPPRKYIFWKLLIFWNIEFWTGFFVRNWSLVMCRGRKIIELMKFQLLFFHHIFWIFDIILLRIYIGFSLKILEFRVFLMLNYKYLVNDNYFKFNYS